MRFSESKIVSGLFLTDPNVCSDWWSLPCLGKFHPCICDMHCLVDDLLWVTCDRKFLVFPLCIQHSTYFVTVARRPIHKRTLAATETCLSHLVTEKGSNKIWRFRFQSNLLNISVRRFWLWESRKRKHLYGMLACYFTSWCFSGGMSVTEDRTESALVLKSSWNHSPGLSDMRDKIDFCLNYWQWLI